MRAVRKVSVGVSETKVGESESSTKIRAYCAHLKSCVPHEGSTIGANLATYIHIYFDKHTLAKPHETCHVTRIIICTANGTRHNSKTENLAAPSCRGVL